MSQPSDICECGEYRSLHDEKGCRLCRYMTGPGDGCTKFRFSRVATAEEREHWKQYQPAMVKIKEFPLANKEPRC